MANKTFIILGNGFSISLIESIKLNDKIDLRNLFTKGDEVVWPFSHDKGFLSRKFCENLWTLGARPTMRTEESINFISNLITCLNVFNTASIKNPDFRQNTTNIYREAHNELSTYLKHLFIHYNSLVSTKALQGIIDKLPLINYIQNIISCGDEVIVISYNYDIFLERLLRIKKVPFGLIGFNNTINKSIKLFKPHGSISFVTKSQTPSGKNFTIKDTFDSIEMNISDLKLDYNLMEDRSLINAIIPPAGDANRLARGWVKYIRTTLMKEVKSSSDKDSLIIYGTSYDHVDRVEIDEIITEINSDVNAIYVNPYPSSTFDSVLSSIFKNYTQLKSGECLLGV